MFKYSNVIPRKPNKEGVVNEQLDHHAKSPTECALLTAWLLQADARRLVHRVFPFS